ncbi:MAG TPA: DUF4123 domain-containing protein [Verrucomicrobiae bacterium]|nr:DUF4123 domain-containing protein [Verrucomicrobiae bacterium]
MALSLPEIVDALWPARLPARSAVFVILDGARDERIYGAVDGTRLPKDCLYTGDLPWQLQMTAPYLVQLERDDRFTKYVLSNGWGSSWGVFLRTETGIKQLRRHLRQFLRVKDERGRRLLFRYYDPRVLRVYLPTCLPAEIEQFYGPIESYLMEGETADEVLEFRNENGRLLTRRPLVLRRA